MSSVTPTSDAGFHPDNRHAGPYDFERLAASLPALESHLIDKSDGSGRWIQFSDAAAVRCLNRAILQHDYGIMAWNLPKGSLCPTVPGRVDTLLHARDLLGDSGSGPVCMLDIGTGASGIYALLAAALFQWNVIACDAHRPSITHLQTVLQSNPVLADRIGLRLQPNPNRILRGVLKNGENITLTVCNPPFYDSVESAQRAHQQKHRTHLRRGLPSHAEQRSTQGWEQELCYTGGEVGFVRQLICESVEFRNEVRWFTTLLSKESSLKLLEPNLAQVEPEEIRIVPMQHGNKRSRILAWRFAR